MGKKNKIKSVSNQKKKAASKEDPRTIKDKNAKAVDAKSTEPKDKSSVVASEQVDKHLEQVAAIAIMPLRLDVQIQEIKAIQMQLLELHKQQSVLLDDCTNLLQELKALKPRNDMEVKLIVDTFVDVKDKLSEVLEHFLPSQLNMLKQVLAKTSEVKPN